MSVRAGGGMESTSASRVGSVGTRKAESSEATMRAGTYDSKTRRRSRKTHPDADTQRARDPRDLVDRGVRAEKETVPAQRKSGSGLQLDQEHVEKDRLEPPEGARGDPKSCLLPRVESALAASLQGAELECGA